MLSRSRSRARPGRPPRRRCCTLVLLAIWSGCTSAPEQDPRLRERLVSFDGMALTRFLAVAERLEGTPLGRWARTIAPVARDCGELFGHLAADARPAPQTLRCVEARPAGELEATGPRARADRALAAFARARRGEADGLILWPIADTGRIELAIEIDDQGGLAIDGWLRPPDDPGGLALVLPDDTAPAPAVVTAGVPLAHLRARPAGGLQLARLIPVGGQADRLFALKGRLLEGALLAGSWELAFLPPARDGRLPLALAALHHRAAEPTARALDEALARLEAIWPIRRTPRRFGPNGTSDIDGGCFLDLPLLPEFAPCWAITDQALLIGYRAEAIEAALVRPDVASPPTRETASATRLAVARAAPGRSEPASQAPSSAAGTQLEIRLDRFADADRARGSGEARPHLGELFSHFALRLEATDDERVRVVASLRSGS